MTTSAVYVVFCLLFIVGFIVANLCICGLLQGAIVIPAVLLCIVAIGALPYLHLQYRKNYDAVKAKVMGFLDKP
jgi:uncharacterized membrane protein YoaK (UPF0700 family)